MAIGEGLLALQGPLLKTQVPLMRSLLTGSMFSKSFTLSIYLGVRISVYGFLENTDIQASPHSKNKASSMKTKQGIRDAKGCGKKLVKR